MSDWTDRDPLASASWNDEHDDDPCGWCELHGDDRDACLAFEAELRAEMNLTEQLADALLGEPEADR